MKAATIAVGLSIYALTGAPVLADGDLAVTNVRLHTCPGAPALDNAQIVMRGGVITEVTAVGEALEGITVLNGEGRVATAGLWNSHVHFTDPALRDDPQGVLYDMLLRYGFTSVVDTGSTLADTQALSDAIADGALAGPRIVTANGSLVYTDGTPSYLEGITLPEATDPETAVAIVNAVLDAGADGIKIFSGSYQGEDEPAILIPPDVIAAISETAHARGAFVMSHPQTRDGWVNAIENGVDVLAHTAPPAGPPGEALVAQMIANNVALIPTVKLWAWELARFGVPEPAYRAFQAAGVAQLGEYAAAGGEILFGTDVGYMRDYDTTEEFAQMAEAGLAFTDLLTALTVNPAKRFAKESGCVEPGAPGDLVLYAGDPEQNAAAFAEVAVTIRSGEVVFEAAD